MEVVRLLTLGSVRDHTRIDPGVHPFGSFPSPLAPPYTDSYVEPLANNASFPTRQVCCPSELSALWRRVPHRTVPSTTGRRISWRKTL
jgi:hypothetical protein